MRAMAMVMAMVMAMAIDSILVVQRLRVNGRGRKGS